MWGVRRRRGGGERSGRLEGRKRGQHRSYGEAKEERGGREKRDRL